MESTGVFTMFTLSDIMPTNWGINIDRGESIEYGCNKRMVADEDGSRWPLSEEGGCAD